MEKPVENSPLLRRTFLRHSIRLYVARALVATSLPQALPQLYPTRGFTSTAQVLKIPYGKLAEKGNCYTNLFARRFERLLSSFFLGFFRARRRKISFGEDAGEARTRPVASPKPINAICLLRYSFSLTSCHIVTHPPTSKTLVHP